jgi:hypothetical protein
VAAVKAGEVRLKDIALDSSRWPERLRKLANNYQNQFELPVLFYALVALSSPPASPTGFARPGLGLRRQPPRPQLHSRGLELSAAPPFAFGAGLAILAAMWLWFALRLYVTG